MKCLFFLQTLKGVPLPYNFRLYTYGPFDSQVLEDLQVAQSLRAVRSTLVQFPGGAGYELQSGQMAEEIKSRALADVEKYGDGIDWVLEKFGDKSAANLEIASTLVFVDRSFTAIGTKVGVSDLTRKVQHVKPHLTFEEIEAEARKLQRNGILTAVAN